MEVQMYASLGGQFMRMHPVVIMAGTPWDVPRAMPREFSRGFFEDVLGKFDNFYHEEMMSFWVFFWGNDELFQILRGHLLSFPNSEALIMLFSALLGVTGMFLAAWLQMWWGFISDVITGLSNNGMRCNMGVFFAGYTSKIASCRQGTVQSSRLGVLVVNNVQYITE